MILPDILYHGTTGLRWALIKKIGYMHTDNKGYIHSTDNLKVARLYGITTYLKDMRELSPETDPLPSEYREYYNIRPSLTGCIVIGIKTSYIIRTLELDPILISIKFNTSYRSYGDIPLEYISIYKAYRLEDLEYEIKLVKNIFSSNSHNS